MQGLDSVPHTGAWWGTAIRSADDLKISLAQLVMVSSPKIPCLPAEDGGPAIHDLCDEIALCTVCADILPTPRPQRNAGCRRG